jgi:hypothetical protein
MADSRFSREYIALSYHPQTDLLTQEGVRNLIRVLEGVLQRMEQRIEDLQTAVATLDARVTALES